MAIGNYYFGKAQMTTRYKIIDAIADLLPKLTKQQLSEILLLAQAWSNGIPLVNIKRQPIDVQNLDEEIKALTLLNHDLEQRNYVLQEQLKEERNRAENQDGIIRVLISENRKLKNQLFMQPGVRK